MLLPYGMSFGALVPSARRDGFAMRTDLGYNSRRMFLWMETHRRPFGGLTGTWMQSEETEKSEKRSAVRDMVETVLLTLLIYVLVRTFLFENYRVVGHSMLPTLVDDQFVIVNKLGYRLYDPQRGDIVVFVDPRTPERKLIKRVIGLPGEVIELRNGQVYVNQRLLDEPYITALGRYSEPPVPIPEGQYYVLGDNRNNSSDSHNWGTLPVDRIVGKAWLSYWPPAAWGVIPSAGYWSRTPAVQAAP
jgi:signal peptidase I